MFSNRQWLS